MKRIALLLCAAAATALAGCGLLPMVKGSGVPATVTYDLGAFSRVAATHGCTVRVVHDAASSLEVTVDDNLVEYLDVRPNGPGAVLVSLKQGCMYAGTTFAAEVHTPSLAGLDLSGGSQAVVSPGFPPLPLAVTLSGAGKAELQSLSSPALSADLSGGSSLTATGTVGTATLLLSGSSQARLLGCPAAAARVDMSGGSQCWLQLGAGSLDVSASGGSLLYYRGSPSINSGGLSGGSRLIRMP